MIGTDRILELVRYLDRKSNEDHQVLGDLRSFLEAVFDSADYQQWLSGNQFLGDRSLDGKPPEPIEACALLPRLKHKLTEFAIMANGRLQAKVDRHRGRIHLTDGFWVDPATRVFPTCDESELICDYIERNVEIRAQRGMLVDPACGSGHHALGMRDRFAYRVSLDINGRALAFCRLNSILQGDVRHLVGFADIFDGVPEEVVPPVDSHVVFAVNMPFAIIPGHGGPDDPISLAQDGGDRAVTLSLAALRAISEFSRRPTSRVPIDAIVLCYTLGNRAKGGWNWELEREAIKIFGGDCVTFSLLEGEKLWRVNGVKEQLNPMPIELLELKADCRHTFRDNQRVVKREAYRRHANALKASGLSHLGYGILRIKIP